MTEVREAAASGLDIDAVGRSSAPIEATWTSRDALLYAVGVGAGQEDPTTELQFTTENTRGVPQQVLPTFAIGLGLVGAAWIPPLGDIDLTKILHAEQGLTLHRPLPVEGRTTSVSTVTGIYDKGSGALITVGTEVRDADSGELLATLTPAMFLRDAGGFGGERGPAGSDWAEPDREPDHVVSYATSPGQPLVFRLSGDRNPIHSDPNLAQKVGFPRPILHGLCTYGFACRALLSTVCDGDASRFGSMSARFSSPVLPGQRLDVAIWRDAGGALFRTTTDAGAVLDRGRFTVA